jgi:hypothetical protein
VNDLENRKKLLLAEAEVYRQTLKLELQNLRIYGIKTRRKLTSFRAGNPALLIAIPMLTSLLARRHRLRRLGAWSFIGWQFVRRLLPLLDSRPPRGRRLPDYRTAAEEYLENKM